MNRREIHGKVRAVAEGVDPVIALTSSVLSHNLPKMCESKFGADELERAYGADFTPAGKVNEFSPIDTGGVRIRNITVTPRHRGDRSDISLPHASRSRLYVTKHEDSQLMHKAFNDTFKSGIEPADALHGAAGERTQSDIQRMMDIRKPENNPHEAYRSQVLPHVFKHLGMTGYGANNQPHAQWHCQAGCGGCPCSPGFILHKSDHKLATGHDIHVDVD